MTQKQLDILYELCRMSRQVLEIVYMNDSLKVKYVDNGGNVFYRQYDVLGHFLELEI